MSGFDAKGRSLLTLAVSEGPNNPDHAQRILAVVVVDATGKPLDLSGGGSGTTALTFEQTTPLDTWVIHHGNGKYPYDVTVVLSDGVEGWADFQNPDMDTTIVLFSAPYAGTASLLF